MTIFSTLASLQDIPICHLEMPYWCVVTCIKNHLMKWIIIIMSQILPGYECHFIRSICGSKNCQGREWGQSLAGNTESPEGTTETLQLGYQLGPIMTEITIKKAKHLPENYLIYKCASQNNNLPICLYFCLKKIFEDVMLSDKEKLGLLIELVW